MQQEKVRVAVLTHGLSVNGIESLMINVFRHMDYSDLDVTVIMALDEGVEPLYEPEAKALGIKTVHICDLDGISKKMQYFKGLYKALRSGKYDVVHANMDMLNGICLCIAKMAGIKRRICHGHTAVTNDKDKSFASRMYRKVMRSMIRCFSNVRIGCSERANQYFYGKKKAEILTNGVDLEAFRQKSAIEPESIGIQPGFRHLTTVGRISDVKNPIFTVETFAALKKIRSDVRLIWVGQGDQMPAAKQRAEELGVSDDIVFLGARTDVKDILPLCDLFLFPSLYEGFGIALVEAQAAGLPCLYSDTITDEANAGGCMALSLEKGAEAWAKVADDVLNDKIQMKIDEGILARFDICKTAKRLEELYKGK